jgi:ATP-dependent helicase/nuclease subunit A
MSGNPSYERSKILISKAGKIEFNLGKDAEEEYILSSGYEELRTGEDGIAEREEANRLLYVAMTRAQDHLVVSSLVRQANSRSAVIEDALKKLPVQKEKLYTSVDHSETVNEEPGIRKSAYVLDKNFKSDFEIEIAESNKRHVVSPSSEAATEMDVLARARVEDVSEGLEDFEVSVQNQDFETASEMSSALRDRRPLGKALHGVMDLVISFGGIPDQETLQSFLWQQAEKHGAMLELISLTKRVGHLLKHPIVLEALEAEQRWPELHLAIADPNDDIRLAEGFADLVYKTAEGYILVDYKTDKDIGASQIMHYQQQLGAYALILEKLTGSLPTKILLLHAEETGTTDIELYID